MLARLRRFLRRRKYVAGALLREWLAPDIVRQVEIVDASELEAGYVTAKIRTYNVLYTKRGLAELPEFAAPRRIAIKDLWRWSGEPWGGPVPADDIATPED